MLSFEADAKTVKGNKLGFYTGILYLAPVDISGYQVCPMAKLAQCDKACLYTSGRGAFNSTQNARIKKTKEFFESRDWFMQNIVKDIESGIRKANKLGMTLLVRLNGTSDIKWENIKFTDKDGKEYDSIMSRFPDVQFYDYTKIPSRVVPKNYDLTFSYSQVVTFKKFTDIAVQKNMRLAVVFRHKENLPTEFLNKPVVNGDFSDVRHLDAQGSIVALYAKGKAKKDNTGFVIDN